ncbi:DUF3889 domain-containing protein [Bacillus cihuensis]|uniref:DUF3889 domain-containing protein n=1 Tax=Bacillus cihuensis TaxID=1208599 RepID=UPI0004123D66|nr:DUF3889 domain-containing protein [Bacillus cihuensis]
MKKIIGILIFILSFSTFQPVMAQTPDYEKYGKIAIAVVQENYPAEEVTDYEYKGRKQLEKDVVEDDFLFLVAEGGKEFNVLVKIKHSLANNKLLNLTVEESK